MGETLFENDYFVQTTANQKAYHRVKSYTSLKCDVWKDYFTMTHSFAWAYTLSQGNAYTHRFSTAYYGIHLTGMYKNWLCLFQLNTSYGELDGEYVDKMNMKDDLMVMYKYKYMALSLGISNFLGRDYKQEWLENRSDLAPSRSWLEGNKNVVFFKLSYTLPMGKQYEASEKKVNNQDSDAGILK